MRRLSSSALVFTAALLSAGPVLARGDTPGGGGDKTPRAETGAQVYRQTCQACHMADAKGAKGAGTIPALAGNPRLASAAYPLDVASNGRGGMPGFKTMLTPAQIAAVVGYVRTHFGNAYAEPVTEADAAKAARP